jgi:metal-responsive CopG/Arc/MetJ family transcriptional regulator
MERLTIRVPEDLTDEIDRRADADDVSTSEAARQLLRRGTEYDRIQEERDRYERQYQQLVEQRQEHTELVEYVETEREIQQQRERRRSAPA